MNKFASAYFFAIVMLFLGIAAVAAQVASGGSYTLEQGVIGNGGGSGTGTGYTVEGTNAQSIAGAASSAGSYSIRPGFWSTLLIPTAAPATVSGRVVTENGRGVKGASVMLNGVPLTAPRITLTNDFGYFVFDDVMVGRSYLVSVSHRRYGFGEPIRFISLLGDIDDIIFTASWGN